MVDDITDMYRSQIRLQMNEEASRRLQEVIDPREDARVLALSLVQLVGGSDFEVGGEMIHPDLVPALMARLGEVRAALPSHEGSITVREARIDGSTIHLVVGLDGACVACGAAPGTLSGIQNDLLADSAIQTVQFDAGILEHFDGIVRDFMIEKSGVTFC